MKNIFESVMSNLSNNTKMLTMLGISGMVSSTILAVKSTPKALDILNEDEDYKYSNIEKIKKTYKCYIPSAVVAAGAITCLIFSNQIDTRRTTALATAYSLSENALKEYGAKVVDIVGEEKDKEVKDEIAKDKLAAVPVDHIFDTPSGKALCLDTISGRYFTSELSALDKIQNTLNNRLYNENIVSLNDFYSELGLPSISVGDDIGWNMNTGLVYFDYSTQFAETNEPCIVLSYSIVPRWNYDKD